MLEFYNHGVMLINALASVAEWLTTPIIESPTISTLIGYLEDFLESFLGNFVNGREIILLILDFFVYRTPSELILGGGLIFILGYKLVKFFTDIAL